MKQTRAQNFMDNKLITIRPFLSLDLGSDIDSPESFVKSNSFPCGTRVVKPLDCVFTVSSRSVVETQSVISLSQTDVAKSDERDMQFFSYQEKDEFIGMSNNSQHTMPEFLEPSFNMEESAHAEESADNTDEMKKEESTPDALMGLSLVKQKMITVEESDKNRKNHTHESSGTSVQSFSILIEEENSDGIEVQLSSSADIQCKEIQLFTHDKLIDDDLNLIRGTYKGQNCSKKKVGGIGETEAEEDSLLTSRKADTIMEEKRRRTESEVYIDHKCDVLSFMQVGCVEGDCSTVHSSSSSECDHEEDNRCVINSSPNPITPTSVLEYSDIDRFLSLQKNEKQPSHQSTTSTFKGNELDHPSKKDAGERYSFKTALLSPDISDDLEVPEVRQQAVPLSNSSMYLSANATITTTLTLLVDQEKDSKNNLTKASEDDRASYVNSYASGALRPLKWVGAKSLLESRLLTDGSSTVTLNGTATISLDAYLQRVNTNWFLKALNNKTDAGSCDTEVTNPRIQDPRWAALLRKHTPYHRPRDWLCHNAHHHFTAEFQVDTDLPFLSRVMEKEGSTT